MALQMANRTKFGSRCFFASALVPLACLATAACSDGGSPKSPPIDGGNGAADAAELPEAGVRKDASAPPAPVEAGLPTPEAAIPVTDSGADDAGGGGDAGDAHAVDASRPGALGAVCSDSAGCQSGHCSESVCCETECNGFGAACNRPGSEGTCASTLVLHVDPIAGQDTFKGTESAPLRTLTFALRVAAVVAPNAAPWRVVLHDGTYSTASGELWPAVAPLAGVKIEAANPGKAVLLGGATDAAMNIEGPASVTGLVAKNFERAFMAYGGPVEFVRVEVDGGRGFVLTDHITATIRDSNLRNLTGIGIDLRERSMLTMTGGSVVRDPLAVGCENAVGIDLTTDAELKLNGVFVGGFHSAGLSAAMVYVDIVDSSFSGNGVPACDGAQLKVLGGAVTTLKRVELLNGKAAGIDVSGDGEDAVTVADSTLTNNYVGIVLHGHRTLRMSRSQITDSFIGIYAPTADDQVLVDLGETNYPGNNVVRGSNRALVLMGAYDPIRLIHVNGNQWNPGVEGADAEGRYIDRYPVIGFQQPVGGNFFTPRVKLDF